MSRTVKMHADVLVTLVVPHEVEVDIDEFDEWREDRGYVGPSWESDLTDHHDAVIEFLEWQDEGSGGELYGGMPAPDWGKHEIWGIDINELEVIAA